MYWKTVTNSINRDGHSPLEDCISPFYLSAAGGLTTLPVYGCMRRREVKARVVQVIQVVLRVGRLDDDDDDK